MAANERTDGAHAWSQHRAESSARPSMAATTGRGPYALRQ
jgi:hypothetical protein